MNKSLSQKLNKFKASPLIVAIAIIEVLILICVSTFAWFVFVENNKVNTDIISVEPDSGLDIDFNDANENDYINIWNYLNEFEFEPVTSVDGRNLFVPTTGTFFDNTGDSDTPSSPENPGDTQNDFLIYFDVTGSNWDQVWVQTDNTRNLSGSNQGYFEMTQHPDDDNVFYINIKDLLPTVSESMLTYIHFLRVPGSNNSNDIAVQLPQHTIYPNSLYQFKDGNAVLGNYNSWYGLLLEESPVQYTGQAPDVGGGGTGNSGSGEGSGAVSNNGSIKFREATVNDMNSKYINIDFTLTNTSGEDMPVYLSSKSYFNLYDPETEKSISSKALRIAFYQNDAASGKVLSNRIGTSSTGETSKTVYFYNTYGWENPTAHIWKENGNNDESLVAWPGQQMIHISGNIYYYTFDPKYDSIVFNDGTNDGAKSIDKANVQDGQIYMLGQPQTEDSDVYDVSCQDYSQFVGEGSYPVICPGVSTGFQRPYAPVTQIDNFNGEPITVIPAFASSIDDYNNGSGNPLFTIQHNQTLSLSMVIWLEGTDLDCTEDVYAGKKIDMNLVFATPNSADEDMYTYEFLDKTKENWVQDTIDVAAGISFEPVMQLYDAQTGKGYLMEVSNDTSGQPTVWTCTAPQDLRNSNHIIFRRVNPLKEDEVWNYWDTDGFGNIPNLVSGNTVTFSAFADGAPTSAVSEDGTAYKGAPTKSCGGLWGDHQIQRISLYDGTPNSWLEDQSSVLTMNYTYDYGNSITQEVEYRASFDGQKNMYYFEVPFSVYSKTGSNHETNIQFKRYYNFNGDYALNSDLNKLTYHMSFDAGTCKGKFFEITENFKGDKWCYWGSDMLYVQNKKITNNKINSSGGALIAEFTPESGTSFVSYLHRNTNYDPDDGGYGYACVIPSDKKYTSYFIAQVSSGDTNNKWNVTPSQSIDYNTTYNNEHSNTIGKNICSIERFEITIFLQLTTSYCGLNNDPQCYAWDNGGSNGNNGSDSNNAFNTAPVMTYHNNQPSGYQQYKYNLDISRFNSIIFHNRGGSNQFQTVDITGVGGYDHDRNGMIYQVSQSNDDKKPYTLLRNSNNNNALMIMSGYKDNETMKVALYEAEYWDKNGS